MNYYLFADSGQVLSQNITLKSDEVRTSATYLAINDFAETDQITIMDSAGNLVLIKVKIESNEKIKATKKVINTYAGPDGEIEDQEMDKGLDDFFIGQGWMEKDIIYWMSEQFINN